MEEQFQMEIRLDDHLLMEQDYLNMVQQFQMEVEYQMVLELDVQRLVVETY